MISPFLGPLPITRVLRVADLVETAALFEHRRPGICGVSESTYIAVGLLFLDRFPSRSYSLNHEELSAALLPHGRRNSGLARSTVPQRPLTCLKSVSGARTRPTAYLTSQKRGPSI